MPSEPIRDAQNDHLITPENSVMIIIDHQPVQVSSIRSTSREEPVFNITGVAKAAVNSGVPIIQAADGHEARACPATSSSVLRSSPA